MDKIRSAMASAQKIYFNTAKQYIGKSYFSNDKDTECTNICTKIILTNIRLHFLNVFQALQLEMHLLKYSIFVTLNYLHLLKNSRNITLDKFYSAYYWLLEQKYSVSFLDSK